MNIFENLNVLFFFHCALQRLLVRAGAVHDLRDLCLGDFEAEDADDRNAADGVHILSYEQIARRVMAETTGPVKCSFCGKERTQVEKLIAGPGVTICDACVALCQLYLDHPGADGRLLIEDGKPVYRDGEPVFVPLSDAERAERDRLLSR